MVLPEGKGMGRGEKKLEEMVAPDNGIKNALGVGCRRDGV